MEIVMKRFLNIISNAVKEGTSDLYITGGHPMVARKHGAIIFHNTDRWTHQEVDELTRQLLTPRQLDDLLERKSVDFAMSASAARLRINVFTTARGISLAIRILPGHIPTIDELNLHPSLHEISTVKSGLILTCGASGVGKTTTIAALINAINTVRQAHIVMLENPIEYRFQSNKSFIQQRELGPHMPSFAQGLVDVLRENPDVIVVGELREPETMRLTLNAAESGHLVIATLHAATPEEAIYRLCNAVPLEAQSEIRYQLASSLKWIIVQQLVYLEKVGYRVPLLTIVRETSSVKNLIRENKLNQLNSSIQLSKTEGMFTPERYLDDYLALRTTFVPYSHTFRPSPEVSQDMLYQSPLTEGEKQGGPPPKKRPLRTDAAPIIVRTDYSSDEMEHMLTINEDESLQELLRKMEK
jgi:twitching motility protein PilT